MAKDEILTDDFVADLLAKEANDCSLKYSAMGMDAFRSDKKPTNMPKPNTRFLRHIIKDTDTHNKALLAKEAAESKARLGTLEQAVEVKRLRTNPDAKDIRKRQMGNIHAILGGKKRRREDEEGDGDQKDRPSNDRNSRSKKDLSSSGHSKRHGRLPREEAAHAGSDTKQAKIRRGGRDGRDEDKRRQRKERDRSRSPRRRSADSREKPRSRRHRSPVRHRRSSADRNPRRGEGQNDDSDPLEDSIGPAPAPKYRGRGTVAGLSGIDRRFSESYDPKTDVAMDEVEEGADWDDAVEAFRDRQKMKQSQEERLRSAGFGDAQIQKINSEATTSGDNVKWSKTGQERQWDLGKTSGSQASGLFQEFSDDEL